VLLTKETDGTTHQECLIPVRFVPMVRESD